MMLFRRLLGDDAVWQRKILSVSGVLFLILLGDAILSFWIPNFLQSVLKTPWLMGLVFSFSSVVGVCADLVLPQILRKVTVDKLVWGAIGAAVIFVGLLWVSISMPLAGVLLLAMGVWGIYYEFLGFASQQFVADATPLRLHSTAWALLTWARSLAYFLGPIIGAWLLLVSDYGPVGTALGFVILGASLLLFLGTRRAKSTNEVELDIRHVDLLHELEHWWVLFVHVWPVVVLSLFLGIIDATFWTTGAVLTERLAGEAVWGWLWLPAYILPSLLTGFILAKRKVVQGKKKLAEKFLLVGCLALIGLWWDSGWLQVGLVGVAGIMFSLAFPLTDAIYSDIVARMGRQRRHLMGLSQSSISLAYIIGPILAGVAASWLGERQAFAVCGAAGVVLAIGLLLTTPKKLLLPQQEIKEWEEGGV